MTDLAGLSQEYTIIVRIDTTKPRGNVSVDLGALPPMLAIEALRCATESVEDLLEPALVFFQSELVEPEYAPAADDDD